MLRGLKIVGSKKNSNAPSNDLAKNDDNQKQKSSIETTDSSAIQRPNLLSRSNVQKALDDLYTNIESPSPNPSKIDKQSLSPTTPTTSTTLSTSDASLNTTNELKREGWMLEPPERLQITKDMNAEESDQNNEKRKTEREMESILSSREMNPYWKNGGNGLPPESPSAGNDQVSSRRTIVVGDGGAGWRARAQRRARESETRKQTSSTSTSQEEVSRGVRPLFEAKDQQRRNRDKRDDKFIGRYKSHVKNDTTTTTTTTTNAATTSTSTTINTSIPIVMNSSKHDVRKATTGGKHSIEGDKNKNAAMSLKAQLLEELDDDNSTQQSHEKKNVVVLPEYDFRGKKLTYNRDDEGLENDVLKMYKQTKDGSGNIERIVEQKMLKRQRYKYDDDLEEQYDRIEDDMFDKSIDTSKMKSKKSRYQKTPQDDEKKQRNMQIKAYKQMQSIAETCPYCFGNQRIKKHMVISLGEKTMLMLPPFGSLIPGHCLIVPIEHKLAVTGLDEDEWSEVQKFKQCLKKMFFEQQKDVIFIETVTPYNLRKQRHTHIDCYPLPLKCAHDAPKFFKKMIMESDDEWTQNRKLVDMKGKGGVRRCIPKDFPYFAVEFGLNDGFAHVIEDESKFSHNIGKEVVIGMLKLPETLLKSYQKNLNFGTERKQVLEFIDQWKPFDWTAELEGGEY